MIEKPFEQQITFISTSDLNKTAHFYENILGLELVLDQGKCRICRTAGDAYLGYCESAGEIASNQGVILTLVTEDVDIWYERLKINGVDIKEPPSENPYYKIYHFFFHDPDGYLIEIQRFLHSFG